MTKRNDDTALKVFEAYWFQHRNLTSEWRVRRGGTTKPIVKGLTRDEAWRSARSLARQAFGAAILLGIDGTTWRKHREFGKDPATTIGRTGAEVAIATIHLRGAASWTPERRQEVADWLRSGAAFLKKHGPELSERYRARFFVHA